MRFIWVCLLVLSISSHAAEALVGVKPIHKVPKSLFLIKKAKIDNDVSDPVLYPKSKQEQTLRDEKIFRKYKFSDSFDSHY